MAIEIRLSKTDQGPCYPWISSIFPPDTTLDSRNKNFFFTAPHLSCADTTE